MDFLEMQMDIDKIKKFQAGLFDKIEGNRKRLNNALEKGTAVAFHDIYHETINNRIRAICDALGMDLNGHKSPKITALENNSEHYNNLDKELTHWVGIMDKNKEQIAELKEQSRIYGIQINSLLNMHRSILNNQDELRILRKRFEDYRILTNHFIKINKEVLRDDYKFKVDKLPENELKKHYEELLKMLESKDSLRNGIDYEKEYICSLELQGECGNEGSMDCLKGNSKGERFDNNVCVHGKKELEKEKPPEPQEICKTCIYWFNMKCALSPEDPISFMSDFKCDAWKPREETWVLYKKNGKKEIYGAKYFKLVRIEDLNFLFRNVAIEMGEYTSEAQAKIMKIKEKYNLE